MRATSPSSRARRAAARSAFAALAIAALPGAARAAVPTPVALPDEVVGVGAAPDGSVHLVMARTVRTYVHYEVAAVSPLGVLGAVSPVAIPSKASSAFDVAPDGSAVFATWHATGPGKGKMTAVTTSPAGVSSAPVPLTGFGPTLLPDEVVVGPTGAAAVVSVDTTAKASKPTLVFRPAGSASFGAGQSLGPALSARKTNVHVVSAKVVLGPDGGGAVLVQQVSRSHTPAPVIRRISPAGVLGPPIPVPIGQHFITTPYLAVAPSGTIAMVFDEDDSAAGLQDSHKVVLTTLAPGAAAVSAPQTLNTTVNSSLGGDNISIAIGAGDQTAVLAGSSPTTGGLVAYTGPLGALSPRGTIPSPRALAAQVVVGADGSATAVWTRTAVGNGPDTLVEAHAPVGSAFAPSVDITDETHKDAGLLVTDRPVALPNGNVALAYSIAASFYGDDFLSFTP